MNAALYCPSCKTNLTVKNDGYYCSHCKCFYPIVKGIPSFINSTDNISNNFNASAYEALYETEQKHFWYLGRREIILDAIKKTCPHPKKLRMLEIGCGSGSILSYLHKNNINIEGADIFIEGLEYCRNSNNSIPLYHLDLMQLPFLHTFDIIGIFDVLEHIDNDEKALLIINKALKPGGNLIMTVPAFQFLWSPFDESACHRRRYAKRDLLEKLERTGFRVNKVTFYMFLLFPVLAIIRLTGNLFSHKKQISNPRDLVEFKVIPGINSLFLSLLRLEKLLIRYVNLPYGSSILITAEKM